MTRPKIGIFHYQTYPEIRVVKFASSLAEAGMDVTVVARTVVGGSDPRGKHPYAGAGDLEPAGVTTRGISDLVGDKPLAGARTTPYPFSPLWRQAIKDVLDEGADLLIARDFHLAPAVVSLGHDRGVPVMVDIAENYPALLRLWRSQEGIKRGMVNSVIRNVALARAVERRGVSRADAVSVVVPEHEQRMRQLGAHNVLTIENTPNLDQLLAPFDAEVPGSLAHVAPNVLKVVYTGEIHLYRGIDTVINAVAILKSRGNTNIRVCLVGTGKLFDQLKAMAAAKGVADQVTFEGWQPDLRPWIAASDVGLIPPHASEHQDMTMPNKLYDFMAFGKPVVVSDAAPMRRVVETSNAGFVFQAGSATGLADQLERLADSKLRAELGENAARAVRQKYNWGTDGALLTATVSGLLASVRPGNSPARTEASAHD